MKRWAGIGMLTACVALAFGCDSQTEVQRQTRDLQEAQKNVAKVTQELEGQLEQAKADVVRLEQKVALARQGLTDDVLENQKELQAALQAQEHKVESELGDAKREAQIHARDTEAALKTLGQAPPPADPAVPPAADPAPAPTAEGVPPAPPAKAVPPAAPAASDTPREDLVPVKGADTESDMTPDPDPVTPPAPPPAPPQPTSPVTDPTGAVPPSPPPAALKGNVAPGEAPPPGEPGHPAPAQP